MADFTPINHKALTSPEKERFAQNIAGSVAKATPAERRQGSHWYGRAHRDAVTLAAGADPRTPGRTRREALSQFRQAPAGERSERVSRAAGTLAALSPSGGGMSWERNVPAAHELGKLSDSDVAKVSAGNREPLAGNNLRFASSSTVARAHEILTGKKAVPHDVKTGNFYRNINNPRDPDSVTIDGRSHDIAIGQRQSWRTTRGLGSKGRYDVLADAHQRARDITGMQQAHQVQAVSWLADKRQAADAGQGVYVNETAGSRGVSRRKGSTL